MPKNEDGHTKEELMKRARELIQQLDKEHYKIRDIHRIGGYLCQAWIK